MRAAEMVYGAVAQWSQSLGRPVPLTLALFGGYRDDHPASVLGLHAMDAARCLALPGGVEALRGWESAVLPPGGR